MRARFSLKEATMRTVMGWIAGLACVLGLLWTAPSWAQRSEGNQLCTFHTTATAAGNGTACDVSGYTLLVIQISGTLTGTVATPEGSVDGTNFTSLYCMSVPSLQIGVTSFGAAGTVRCTIAGYQIARLRLGGAGASTSVSAKGIALMGNFATNFP
jgi:hypothetical protein